MINITLLEMNTVGAIFLWIGLLLAGFVIGFFVTRKIFQNQLKKNPPITEAQIRALYRQMGRTPSEAQVRQAMRAMNQK